MAAILYIPCPKAAPSIICLQRGDASARRKKPAASGMTRIEAGLVREEEEEEGMVGPAGLEPATKPL